MEVTSGSVHLPSGGDLLVAVGARLTAAVRGHDIVARVAGDEFVVVATEVASEAAAVELGNKLLAVFHAPFPCDEHICQIGVTIGYVLAPQDGVQIGELLKAADAAMYSGQAARQGHRGARDSLD